MPFDFTPPPRARFHCKHYSYESGLKGGPRCAVNLLVEGAPVLACMPEPREQCPGREDWTDEERAAYAAWGEVRTARLIAAIQALPAAIPLRSGGWIDCPNCDGRIRYDRWHRGAELHCTTPYCCGAHFSIAPGVDWPQHAQ